MSEQSLGGSDQLKQEVDEVAIPHTLLRIAGRCLGCGSLGVNRLLDQDFWEQQAKSFKPRCTNRMCGQKILLYITVTEL